MLDRFVENQQLRQKVLMTEAPTSKAFLSGRFGLIFFGLAVVIGPSCAKEGSSPPALDRAKLETIVVGRSSRSEVFAALARPTRTERSAQGETWIYETKHKGNRESILGGAAAGSALLGAFVPYAGLVSSGVGLASAATGGGGSTAETSSLSVLFGADGIVRDCLYVTTASPVIEGQSKPEDRRVPDCRRPVPKAGP